MSTDARLRELAGYVVATYVSLETAPLIRMLLDRNQVEYVELQGDGVVFAFKEHDTWLVELVGAAAKMGVQSRCIEYIKTIDALLRVDRAACEAAWRLGGHRALRELVPT